MIPANRANGNQTLILIKPLVFLRVLRDLYWLYAFSRINKVLHLIFQSPIETAVLERTEAGDAVVFIGNSVGMTLRQGRLAESLVAMAQSRLLYVLSDDIVMRGIAHEALAAGIDVIDYSGLVALTLEHKVIQSWY